MAQSLKDKSAIVTGSSRGIGAAVALWLASHGANVVINYVNSSDAAQKVCEQARGKGVKAIAVRTDVSQKVEVEALFRAAKEAFGKIHILMSNAGVEHF